jgi:hypothetical protein
MCVDIIWVAPTLVRRSVPWRERSIRTSVGHQLHIIRGSPRPLRLCVQINEHAKCVVSSPGRKYNHTPDVRSTVLSEESHSGRPLFYRCPFQAVRRFAVPAGVDSPVAR